MLVDEQLPAAHWHVSRPLELLRKEHKRERERERERKGHLGELILEDSSQNSSSHHHPDHHITPEPTESGPLISRQRSRAGPAGKGSTPPA
jgi:hypothetical protein